MIPNPYRGSHGSDRPSGRYPRLPVACLRSLLLVVCGPAITLLLSGCSTLSSRGQAAKTSENATIQLPRGRPVLNPERTTFVADNGRCLRGPFVSTEWGDPPPDEKYAFARSLGCNAIHLYAECFDINHPAPGSTAPGYALERIDRVVATTRELGMYLVITIGNGGNNGTYNTDYILDFWRLYAPRYKDETHVIYEIQNEPVAWSPPYGSPKANPPGALDMELAAYNLIRSLAPETPILLFSYSVLGKGEDALQDLAAIGDRIDWSNAAVAFHGYAGHEATTKSLETILAAGYPCFMTEFCATDWGTDIHMLDVELTAELERLKISWLAFLLITRGIGPPFEPPEAFHDAVLNAGLSWPADYGDWPPPRGVYGNDGRPRMTASTWDDERLVGTLRIEAEAFDLGGEGVAYHDKDTGNDGGLYRPGDDVDLQAVTGSGSGVAVAPMDAGEWLEYTLFIKEPGDYDLALRYASPGTTSAVRIAGNGKDVTGTWELPDTGAAGRWATAMQQVFLEYGRQKLRVEMVRDRMRLDWIELSPVQAGIVADGTYKLLNHRSGLAMEAVPAKNKVVQAPFSGEPLQQWQLKHVGANQYKVSATFPGEEKEEIRYWSVFYTDDGKPLDAVPWWGIEGRNQRFLIMPLGDGFWRIRPAKGGSSLAVAGAPMAEGAQVQQFGFSGQGHQEWAILPLGAPAFPAQLKAKTGSGGGVDLSWAGVPGATSYNVKRAGAGEGPYTTVASVTEPAFHDSTPPNRRVYYVVSAVADGTESPDSTEARPPALVVHLPLNETRGKTATDSTGNNLNGRLVEGATFGDGALVLDDKEAHLALPAGVVSELEDFTIAVWVRLPAVQTWSRILDFGSGTDNYMFLTASAHGDGTPRFAIRTPEVGEQVVRSRTPLPTGKWVHLAITRAGTTGTLYVNGEAVGTSGRIALTPADLGNTTANYLGRSQWPADPFLQGALRDLRIYDAALGGADISAAMNAGR